MYLLQMQLINVRKYIYLQRLLVNCFMEHKYSIQIENNIKNINKLISTYEVLNIDSETSAIYGKVKAILRKNGTPIPENDIWIAATAIQHKLNLSTRDNHFKQIPDLNLLNW